jgi:hypothetical protein
LLKEFEAICSDYLLVGKYLRANIRLYENIRFKTNENKCLEAKNLPVGESVCAVNIQYEANICVNMYCFA